MLNKTQWLQINFHVPQENLKVNHARAEKFTICHLKFMLFFSKNIAARAANSNAMKFEIM